MSPVKILSDIYKGQLIKASLPLPLKHIQSYALELLRAVFDCDSIPSLSGFDKAKFVECAATAKHRFTNSLVLHELISKFCCDFFDCKEDYFLYDKPRLRIIPTSNLLSTGVSYNYRLHRDTWYGAGIDQVNIWFPIANVSRERTFCILPTYFHKFVENTSYNFDLDEWDRVYRPMAQSVSHGISEERPHPTAVDELQLISQAEPIDLHSDEFIMFSGNHLHGSLQNSTQLTRVSCDFRLYPRDPDLIKSLVGTTKFDSKAKGDYRKYLSSFD